MFKKSQFQDSRFNEKLFLYFGADRENESVRIKKQEEREEKEEKEEKEEANESEMVKKCPFHES